MHVPVVAVSRVDADLGVQTPVVGVDDVNDRSFGAADLQLAALARVPRVPAVLVLFCSSNHTHHASFHGRRLPPPPGN